MARYCQEQSPAFVFPHPVHEVQAHEHLVHALTVAEEELPPHQAQAVHAQYKYGLDDEEAAQKMEISIRTFSRYLSLGMKRLRELMRNNQSD